MLSRKAIVTLACLTVLAACQKINISGISDAQTVDYFLKNPKIAMAISTKCDDFERKDFSKMSSAQQTNWQDSTDGINCKNAGTAVSVLVWNERQRKLKESASKYQ